MTHTRFRPTRARSGQTCAGKETEGAPNARLRQRSIRDILVCCPCSILQGFPADVRDTRVHSGSPVGSAGRRLSRSARTSSPRPRRQIGLSRPLPRNGTEPLGARPGASGPDVRIARNASHELDERLSWRPDEPHMGVVWSHQGAQAGAAWAQAGRAVGAGAGRIGGEGLCRRPPPYDAPLVAEGFVAH